MLTEEQITALAHEYAEFTDLSPVDKKNVSLICKWFLEYTLRRYCLVEKSKVKQFFQSRQNILSHQNEYDRYIVDEASAEKRLMLCLFPDLGKEVKS